MFSLNKDEIQSNSVIKNLMGGDNLFAITGVHNNQEIETDFENNIKIRFSYQIGQTVNSDKFYFASLQLKAFSFLLGFCSF